MEKGLKNQRKSLDPSKGSVPMAIFKKGHNATELEVKTNSHEESQSTISNNEQFSGDELSKTFRSISKGKDYITAEALYSLLKEEGYAQQVYSAVQMISLADQGRKGYVTEKDFKDFFSDKNYVDEEKIPPLTEEMIQDRKWVEKIEQNWEDYKHYLDKEYCSYVADKLKEEIVTKRQN